MQGDTGGYGGPNTGVYGGIRPPKSLQAPGGDPETGETRIQAELRRLMLQQLQFITVHQARARETHWTGPAAEAELATWRHLKLLCTKYRDALDQGT